MEFIITEVLPEEDEPVVLSVPPIPAPTGNFRFVQEDELEIEEPTQPEPVEETVVDIEVDETVTSIDVNGNAVVEETVKITTTEVSTVHNSSLHNSHRFSRSQPRRTAL